jgi:hypothetical protein
MENKPNTTQPRGSLTFDHREQAQIEHARHYRDTFSPAGVPGHGQFLLIARLADLLSDAVSRFGYAPDATPPVRVQKIAWQEADQTWRDIETGVKVTL